ncbi:hypothetical protein G7051_17615 [Dysgonomonas sp. HDW5B]|uniref:exonuclease domain-containing protein n=1 Tax=Dysgonomonas sp. HDW5B TaxID=2714927 RepID=UPI00140D771D|nr:exonuclease domain-containing protein [Dysgonomonas sp. HDW5B]QIK56079.1 hypothetical protein G7051_17615 [Dysgonomonas sp. HDW5B]
MENINFTAFDFETAYGHKNACQIGLVVVKKGVVVLEKSYLIQPPENKISAYCTKIHGIKPEMTKDAPSFLELWNEIKPHFEKQVIVHHSDGFDMRVLNQEFDYYKIPPCRFLAIESTMELFPYEYSRSLSNLCSAYNIDLGQHHEALSDARCCANIFLKYLNGETPDYSILPKKKINRQIVEEPDEEYLEWSRKGIVPDRLGSSFRELEKQIAKGDYSNIEIIEESNELIKKNRTFTPNPDNIIASETKIQDLSIVNNTNTLFYDKKIVISGVFERFPVRNDLGILLKNYGADINGSISRKTNIFIVGNDCGPSKLQKALELKDNNINILILEEKELYSILDSIN